MSHKQLKGMSCLQILREVFTKESGWLGLLSLKVRLLPSGDKNSLCLDCTPASLIFFLHKKDPLIEANYVYKLNYQVQT